MVKVSDMVIITVKMPRDMVEKLMEFCRQAEVTRSEVIRAAVKEYLEGADSVPRTRWRVKRVILR